MAQISGVYFLALPDPPYNHLTVADMKIRYHGQEDANKRNLSDNDDEVAKSTSQQRGSNLFQWPLLK